MLGNLTGWHFLILLAVILLVFGAAKLPALAKSMGQSARVFKGEMKAMKEDDAADAQAKSIQAPVIPPVVAPPIAPEGSAQPGGTADPRS